MTQACCTRLAIAGLALVLTLGIPAEAASLQFDAEVVPKVEDGRAILPEELREDPKMKRFGLHFPKPQDLMGEWRSEEPQFLAVGDFNRDSVPDVAAILLGESYTEWKLAVFSSKPGRVYEMQIIFYGKDSGLAQNWCVGLVLQGERVEGFSLTPKEACGGWWRWNGSSYEQPE